MRPILPKGTARLPHLKSRQNQGAVTATALPKTTMIILTTPSPIIGLQHPQISNTTNSSVVATNISSPLTKNKRVIKNVKKRQSASKNVSKIKASLSSSQIMPILPKQSQVVKQNNISSLQHVSNVPSIYIQEDKSKESSKLTKYEDGTRSKTIINTGNDKTTLVKSKSKHNNYIQVNETAHPYLDTQDDKKDIDNLSSSLSHNTRHSSVIYDINPPINETDEKSNLYFIYNDTELNKSPSGCNLLLPKDYHDLAHSTTHEIAEQFDNSTQIIEDSNKNSSESSFMSTNKVSSYIEPEVKYKHHHILENAVNSNDSLIIFDSDRTDKLSLTRSDLEVDQQLHSPVYKENTSLTLHSKNHLEEARHIDICYSESDDSVKESYNFDKSTQSNYEIKNNDTDKYVSYLDYSFSNNNIYTLSQNESNESSSSVSNQGNLHFISYKDCSSASGTTSHQAPSGTPKSRISTMNDRSSNTNCREFKCRHLTVDSGNFIETSSNYETTGNKMTLNEEDKDLYLNDTTLFKTELNYYSRDNNNTKPPPYHNHLNAYKLVESCMQPTTTTSETCNMQFMQESEVFNSTEDSDSYIYCRRGDTLMSSHQQQITSSDDLNQNFAGSHITNDHSRIDCSINNSNHNNINDNFAKSSLNSRLSLETIAPPMYQSNKYSVFDLSTSSNMHWINYNLESSSAVDHPLALLSKKTLDKKNETDKLDRDISDVLSFVESAEKILLDEENKNINSVYLERKQHAKNVLTKIGNKQVLRIAEMEKTFGIVEDVPIDKTIEEGIHSSGLMTSSNHIICSSKSKITKKQSFLCQICGKMIKQRSGLKAHLAMHKDAKEYHCPYCSKRFNYRTVLTNHIRTHTQEKPYKCAICSSSFLTRTGLIKHRVKHQVARPYECSVCSKSFKTKSVLKYHLRSHDIGPFVCSQCGAAFNGMKSLAAHQTSHRFITKKYSCPHCKKRYLFKSLLTRHMQIHFNIRKHCCHICGAAFVWKSSLTTHVRTHSNVRVNCTLCKASFISEKRLQLHYLKHVDPRPHKCGECSQSFSHSYKLVSHMERHKKRSLALQCIKCNLQFLTKKELKNHNVIHI